MKRSMALFMASLMALAGLALSGCSSRPTPNAGNTTITVNPVSEAAADGLNLQAVGELAKQAHNATEFEQMLNDPARGLDNLDLNRDGKVDYLSVKEYGSGDTRGFAIYDDLGDNQIQEIADIKIQQTAPQQAVVQIQGNEQIYGPDHYYTSHFSFGDALLVAWLFSPHPLYYSPYHWGYYPPAYGYYAPVPIGIYRTRVQTITRTTTIQRTTTPQVRSSVTSPMAGRSAATVRAPLAKPSTAQVEFQKRDPGKSVGSGGFGQHGTATGAAGSRPTPSATGASRPSAAPPRPSSSGGSRPPMRLSPGGRRR